MPRQSSMSHCRSTVTPGLDTVMILHPEAGGQINRRHGALRLRLGIGLLSRTVTAASEPVR